MACHIFLTLLVIKLPIMFRLVSSIFLSSSIHCNLTRTDSCKYHMKHDVFYTKAPNARQHQSAAHNPVPRTSRCCVLYVITTSFNSPPNFQLLLFHIHGSSNHEHHTQQKRPLSGHTSSMRPHFDRKGCLITLYTTAYR
jgi:hypothetical protein